MTFVTLISKAREELQAFHFRLRLAEMALAPLPPFVASRVRAQALRMAGFRIGHATVFWGTPDIRGAARDIYDKLSIGSDCWFNAECHLDLCGDIRIGDRVSIGPQVMILTSTHDIAEGITRRRAGVVFPKPVVIEDGVWLGARSTILPGVTVGEGSVVAAGAVVHHDVPPNAMVAGVPARVVKEFVTRTG